MKQTAVEWLANEFYEKLEVKGDGALFNDLVNQAKEMEKQQQGYSEELIQLELLIKSQEELILTNEGIGYLKGLKTALKLFKNK
jgi:hypothetical protein